jgi:hypothetical protein
MTTQSFLNAYGYAQDARTRVSSRVVVAPGFLVTRRAERGVDKTTREDYSKKKFLASMITLHASGRGVAASLAISLVTAVLYAAPARAVTGSFNFSIDPEVNFSSRAFNSSTGGFTATVSSPVASGFQPATGGLNASSQGLCAWSSTGTTAGRCGYNVAGGAPSGSGLRGFTLSFNQFVFLDSFQISQFAPSTGATPVNNASMNFHSSSSGQTVAFNITGPGTTYTFSTPLSVAAGADLFITTSGLTSSSNGGVFRMQSLSVSDVPGPLPLLGVGAAFGWSRKLRRKMKQSAS